MGQEKDTKNLNNFITPGLFPAHIVIWCPDWFSKKYQDLYFRKWVLDVENDFLLSDCIVSSENLADFEGICGYQTQHGLYAD